MANYCCATRTNYFHVKDLNAFQNIMATVAVTEDSIDIWEEKDENGDTVYGFGCYGSILGIPIHDGKEIEDDYCCDYDYEKFAEKMSTCVADDDAIIILESGNEKLRYVTGTATIIAHDGYKYLNMSSLATDAARLMLENPNWKTQTSY